MNSIEIKDMTFSYGKFPVLEDINFNVAKGEFVALIGGNGSGKSTLIKNLLGELRPDSGRVEILGTPIEEYEDFSQIGYVPQLSIVDQIAFPVTTTELVSLNLYREFGFFKVAKKDQLQKSKAILKDLGLEKYIDWPVNELSGGLKQRTMIARAMVNQPKLLILDEPTAGIDQENREYFIRMIDRLNKEKNLTVLLITHELDEVLEFGDVDTVYEIKNKKITELEINSLGITDPEGRYRSC